VVDGRFNYRVEHRSALPVIVHKGLTSYGRGSSLGVLRALWVVLVIMCLNLSFEHTIGLVLLCA
jgi:hypothetical protein